MKLYLKVHHSAVIKLQVFELSKQLYFVGRSENCHIVVNANSYISRCHLSLVLNKDGERFYYAVHDGNIIAGTLSRRGVYVDKIKIEGSKRLKSGCIIDFQPTDKNRVVYPYLEYFEELEETVTDLPTESYEFTKEQW